MRITFFLFLVAQLLFSTSHAGINAKEEHEETTAAVPSSSVSVVHEVSGLPRVRRIQAPTDDFGVRMLLACISSEKDAISLGNLTTLFNDLFLNEFSDYYEVIMDGLYQRRGIVFETHFKQPYLKFLEKVAHHKDHPLQLKAFHTLVNYHNDKLYEFSLELCKILRDIAFDSSNKDCFEAIKILWSYQDEENNYPERNDLLQYVKVAARDPSKPHQLAVIGVLLEDESGLEVAPLREELLEQLRRAACTGTPVERTQAISLILHYVGRHKTDAVGIRFLYEIFIVNSSSVQTASVQVIKFLWDILDCLWDLDKTSSLSFLGINRYEMLKRMTQDPYPGKFEIFINKISPSKDFLSFLRTHRAPLFKVLAEIFEDRNSPHWPIAVSILQYDKELRQNLISTLETVSSVPGAHQEFAQNLLPQLNPSKGRREE